MIYAMGFNQSADVRRHTQLATGAQKWNIGKRIVQTKDCWAILVGNQIGGGDKWQRNVERKCLKYMHEKVGYWPENGKK